MRTAVTPSSVTPPSVLGSPAALSPLAGTPADPRPHFLATWRVFVGHLPEVLVFLSLCSLLGINYYQSRSVRASLEEINWIIEPSTRAASDLQLALSKEAASTRAFLLTGNVEYAAEFRQARAERVEALAQLGTLSSGTIPGIEEVLSEILAKLTVADRWLDGLYSGTITPAAYLAEFPHQHRRFTAAAASAATIHQRLRTQATADRRQIAATQRVSGRLETAGVFLAILAGLAVLRLKRQEHAARVSSERSRADAEQRRAQLESVTARWTRLIRGFSHDLKNPLNAADGYLFMLERGVMSGLAPAQLNAVLKSRRAVQTAIALTVDLVDLARAETADVNVRRVEIKLCELVASVAEDYEAQAFAKGLALVTDLPPFPETVESDPARVSQILGNLVSNAVKYTTAGTITVAVRRRLDAAGIERVAVDVTDTGPGIPQEHQRRVFGEFEQLECADPKGTGIGLAISERLAHTLDGALTLQSEEGKGSTFTLWLPLTRRR